MTRTYSYRRYMATLRGVFRDEILTQEVKNSHEFIYMGTTPMTPDGYPMTSIYGRLLNPLLGEEIRALFPAVNINIFTVEADESTCILAINMKCGSIFSWGTPWTAADHCLDSIRGYRLDSELLAAAYYIIVRGFEGTLNDLAEVASRHTYMVARIGRPAGSTTEELHVYGYTGRWMHLDSMRELLNGVCEWDEIYGVNGHESRVLDYMQRVLPSSNAYVWGNSPRVSSAHVLPTWFKVGIRRLKKKPDSKLLRYFALMPLHDDGPKFATDAHAFLCWTTTNFVWPYVMIYGELKRSMTADEIGDLYGAPLHISSTNRVDRAGISILSHYGTVRMEVSSVYPDKVRRSKRLVESNR